MLIKNILHNIDISKYFPIFFVFFCIIIFNLKSFVGHMSYVVGYVYGTRRAILANE